MDASCTIQDSIHVFSLVHKYVSSILGTYQISGGFQNNFFYYVIYHAIYYDILQVLLYDVMAKPIRTNVFNLSIIHKTL